jgi:hypothetical protein
MQISLFIDIIKLDDYTMEFFFEESSEYHHCMCLACVKILHLTDGDYDHDFLVGHEHIVVENEQPAPIPKTEPEPDPDSEPMSKSNADNSRHQSIHRLHRRHISQTREPSHSKYVKFTKKQKEYLRRVFEIYPFVGCHDVNKTRIIFICDNLVKMGYVHQKITRDVILSWFKNERFRCRRRKIKTNVRC